jgi:hypothetical protein
VYCDSRRRRRQKRANINTTINDENFVPTKVFFPDDDFPEEF